MGKTSVPKNLKKNDVLRCFPKLGEPLTKEQQAQLDAMLGTKVLAAESENVG
jgi:hypothetical protein